MARDTAKSGTKSSKKAMSKSAKAEMNTNADDAIKLGIAAVEQGDRDGANRIFNDTVALDPGNAEAWVWLAGTSTDLDDAESAFEKAYALDPNNEQASLGLRWVRLRRKVALNEMVGAVVSAPDNSTSTWNKDTSYAPLSADLGQLITVQCPNCGKENGLSEKFCLDCGQDLRAVPSMATSTPSYIKPEPVKDGLPRYVITATIVVVLIIAAGLLIWFLTQPH